jgi:hypothetical protein
MSELTDAARVLASGATELWAEGMRRGGGREHLSDAALEAERPLHVAVDGGDSTLCGTDAGTLHEYPIDFAAQEQRIRCPICDRLLGHPTRQQSAVRRR